MLTFLKRLAASVPTPATDKVTVFVEDSTGEPSYKDDTGTVTSLKGDPGEGVPAGGTAGQVLRKIDGTDYNTQWVTPSGGVSDGDKGDITVSSGGTAWTIDAAAVTYAKMQNISATQRILGRNTAGAGVTEEVTFSQFLDWVGSAANGDILFRTGGAWSRLPIGTNGQVLTVSSLLPAWGAGGGGGLTNWAEASSTAAPNASIPANSFTPVTATTHGDAVVRPKGTAGAFLLAVPDNTTTGGSKRGSGAVDLQLSRAAASQVASGTNSFAAGVNNTPSGTNAVAIGSTNAVSGQDSVAFGNNNTVSNSSFAFGSLCQVNGVVSFGTGTRSSDRGLNGVWTFAGGQFSAVGDAQDMRAVYRIPTTNATTAAATANGGAASTTNQLVLPNASMYAVEAIVVCRENATGDSSAWRVTAAAKRGANAAATSLVGTPSVTLIGQDAGASTWSLAVVADTTNGALRFDVTGEAAHNIKWVVDVIGCAQVVG